MKNTEDNTKTSNPQWLEHINQLYRDSFLMLFTKLDKQLTSSVTERSSAGFYEEFMRILSFKLENNQTINLQNDLLEAMLNIYGRELYSRDVLSNPEIAYTIMELLKVLQEVVDMIFMRDTFDKLKGKPLFYN
jgi:hypothetical protein